MNTRKTKVLRKIDNGETAVEGKCRVPVDKGSLELYYFGSNFPDSFIQKESILGIC
jgi:hypothetical protein